MRFSETIDAAKALLQRKGRMTRRALAREFGLDAEALQDLVDELVLAERVAIDEGGVVLVWHDGPAAAVEAPPPDTAPPPATPAEPGGARRQLTVMFCDLVGSTALSERLDPEDLHRVVTAYQQAVLGVVQRYEGHVAQYLGDGILAYFGYPVAHEDETVRAVRAGLDILVEIENLGQSSPAQVRVGLHTGPVVIGTVGETGRTEQLALGRTPNVAARVQAAAEPQSLVISGSTHRLVEGMFECHELGARVLKGIAQPVSLFQVVGPAQRVSTRFDVMLQRGLKPLQGRSAELQRLQQLWRLSCGGQGQVAMLSGDPGIGKSRLLQALGEAVGTRGVARVDLRCSVFHTGSPLFPLTEQLARMAQLSSEHGAEGQLATLRRFLEPSGLGDAQHLDLFAQLLSVSPTARAAEGVDREQRRERTQQALVDWVLSLARAQPVLLTFEDLHWADPTTLDLLARLVDHLPQTRMMMVLSSRRDFTPAWSAGPDRHHLVLTRLDAAQIAGIAAAIAGRPVPDEVVQLLVRKTDGVPLFVEEMTRDLLESRLLREQGGQLRMAGSLLNLAVPFSLQDAMTSRLDRLGPARRLAELAAVLGRDFSHDWIAALHDGRADALEPGLDALCRADILVQQGDGARAQYSFRHALLRDAAYASLLIRQRQQAHSRFAQYLQSQRPELAVAQPELVAHHFTEAGMVDEAVGLWRCAGLRAVERSANQEAIRQFSTALEILRTLPEGPPRDRRELALLMDLGVPLSVTTSWAAPEVRLANERALELCERLGESTQLFQALYGVWSNRQVQADYRAARPISQRLLALARQAGDDGLLLQAHRAAGILAMHTGQFAEALRHCDAGYALYDPDSHHVHVAQYWLDPGVGCLCYGAWARACMGHLDEALDRASQALALARQGGHAFTVAYAMHFLAVVHQTRREPGPTAAHAEALLGLTREKGFPALEAWGKVLLGWACAEGGRPKEAIELIRQAQEMSQSAGARVARSASLAVLAGVYARAGAVDAGLAAVAEGLELANRCDERFYEGELLRLRGELNLQRDPSIAAQAMADLRAAIALSREQQALTWELRGATALARVLEQRGQPDAARDVLGAPLALCAEGRDTADHCEARALLDRLTPAAQPTPQSAS
ncbi:MAG: AAA family ATPase [Burkholderiaceae bacterium]|nr:AAA family ATPase [Burkholderiaceae bacterium]